MRKNIVIIDVDDRIKKFNKSAYNVLINTKDLSEALKCEIIVKKVFACIFLYGIGGTEVFDNDIYIRCIFHIEKFLYTFFIYH